MESIESELSIFKGSANSMNANRTFSSAVLAAGIIAVGLAQPAAAAEKKGDTHSGHATVKLRYVYGLLQNGSADPAHDAACKKQLSSPNSRFVGMPVTTRYTVDTKTLMMSAKSTFPSPHSTQPLELTVPLNALGIAGSYSFGAFRPKELPQAYAVLFSIGEKFTGAKSSFVVFGPKDEAYNCLISSAKTAFKDPESAKFGVEESAK
ncbi:MAG: hypothetical protein K8F27_03765 [Sulfuricellaceae bacterium]|nr:hypothetical protein [Sulfuricellaceae bacterium]